MSVTMDLRDRRVAVLGGCGGIGRVVVAGLLAHGARVAVLDLPASLQAHPVSSDIPAYACDATDPVSLQAAASDIAARWGGLEGFVNLAGFMTPREPVATVSPAIWEEVLAGNLTSSFHAAQAMLPLLARAPDGAAMVLTASGLGAFARPGYGPYAAAKAGVMQLTRQLALENAPRIRVNCVAPSAVDTAFLRSGTGRSASAEAPRFDMAAYAASVPLGRIAVPEDVAGPILYLLSDMARYVTGQALHVNGGTYMP